MQEYSQACKTCSKKFSTQSDFEKHLEWHELLTKHMQQSSYVKLDRIKIYECDFCTRGFLDQNDFKQHRKKYFKINLNSKSEDNNNQFEKPFKCKECGWRFVKESTLKTHSILHEPFQHTCECGIGYYKKCDLDNHRRLVHPLFKPVQSTVPKVKPELFEKYKLEDQTESESEPEKEEKDDYRPHIKVGPRLRASLKYKQPRSKPNDTSENNQKKRSFVKRNDKNLVVEKNELGRYICPVCAKTYATKGGFNVHMTVHTGMQYKCDECPKEYPTENRLLLHKQFHAGIKNFKCEFCEKKFRAKNQVEIHMRIHTGVKPYLCSFCPKRFSQHSAHKLHILRHKGERNFKCDQCNNSFISPADLARHTRVHTGEKPYACKYCGKCFADPSAYRRHELIHTGLKPYRCKFCPKAFCDPSALYVHTRRHQDWSIQCTVCNKAFRSRSQMLNHIKIKHKTIKEEEKYECDYCAKTFMLKSYLVSHIVNGHSGTASKVECEICGKKIKNQYYLNMHIQRIHIRNLKYECDKCGMLFPNSTVLRNHKRVQHDRIKEKNFECDHCHMTFFVKAFLWAHIVRKHLDIKCEECKVPFSTTRNLRIHKSEGCKRCPTCNIAFPTKKSLDDHFTVKHLPRSERKIFECDYCCKQFPIRANLQKHIKLLHEAVKKKYCCNDCNETFSNRSAITGHIWDKHMVSLYCNVCLKRFYNESEFQQHKRSTDCSVKEPTLLCDICERVFMTAKQLRMHLSSHGPKIMECDLCGVKYKTRSLILRHMKSAHGFKTKK